MSIKHESGFTLVEIIVTIVVGGVFVALLATGYQVIVSHQQSIVRYTTANNIAKANLNKYRIGSGTVCNTSNPSAVISLLTNTTGNPEPIPSGNYPNFTQTVTAQYVHGCSALPTIISVVSYGPVGSTETITQVDYGK